MRPARAFFAPLIVSLAVMLVGCAAPPAPITQPIRFNHKAHIAKGMGCAFCHSYVLKANLAGIPAVKTCAICHFAQISKSPQAELVRGYVTAGKEIPWHRIYKVPTYVQFSHRRHVTLGKLQCEQCHGDIKGSQAPQVQPAVALTMDTCVSCHEQRKANTDCLACHH